MKQQPARQPGLSSRLVQRTQRPRRARVDWQPRHRIKTLWISQAVRRLGRNRRLGQRAWNARATGMDRRLLLRRKMLSSQQAARPPSRTSSGAEERAQRPRRRRMTVDRVRGRATFPAALTFGPTILEAKATETIAVAGNRAGRRLTVTEPRKVGSKRSTCSADGRSYVFAGHCSHIGQRVIPLVTDRNDRLGDNNGCRRKDARWCGPVPIIVMPEKRTPVRGWIYVGRHFPDDGTHRRNVLQDRNGPIMARLSSTCVQPERRDRGGQQQSTLAVDPHMSLSDHLLRYDS
jgi:hypothetical protein